MLLFCADSLFQRLFSEYSKEKGGKNMEKAKYPMPTMNITQGYNQGTHKGAYALDMKGEDQGIDWVLAPFTGVIRRVDNASYGIWYWFESTEPVLCSNGEVTYLTAMFGHDNKVRHQVGSIIKQGERLCAEGTSGNASGNHCHMEIGRGRFVTGGWYKNRDGVYMIYNAVKPNEYLCVPDSYRIVNNGGLVWKKESQVTLPSHGESVDQVLHVGSKIELRGIYKISAVSASKNAIACTELADTPFLDYNYIDAEPCIEVDKNGVATKDQVCDVNHYIKIPGTFIVLAVDKATDACKIKIGNRQTWVKCGPCTEV